MEKVTYEKGSTHVFPVIHNDEVVGSMWKIKKGFVVLMPNNYMFGPYKSKPAAMRHINRVIDAVSHIRGET